MRTLLVAFVAAALLTQAGCTSLHLIFATRGELYVETGETHGVADVHSAKLSAGQALQFEVRYDDGHTRTLSCSLDGEPTGELTAYAPEPLPYFLATPERHGGASTGLSLEVAPSRLAARGLGPRAWWRPLPDGSALVSLDRGGRLSHVLVPRYAVKEGITHPLKLAGRIVGLPLAIALDLATLPLQPLFLPVTGPMLMFLAGPV